jgi:hypothetical protein
MDTARATASGDRQGSSSPVHRHRFDRRKFLVGGLAAGAGFLARPGTGLGATADGPWVTYTSSGPDAASISYPVQWFLDTPSEGGSLDGALLYPHQSLSLRTANGKPPIDTEDSGLPDLSGYPSDAAIIWLMYYDEVVEGGPLTVLSLEDLDQGGNLGGFELYVGRFSNSVRSFLLWTWLGLQTPQETANDINSSLRSISVPN